MHKKIKPILFFISGVLATWLPYPVFACAVCFTGERSVAKMYLATAIVMSLIPFFVLGGIGYFVLKKSPSSNNPQ